MQTSVPASRTHAAYGSIGSGLSWGARNPSMGDSASRPTLEQISGSGSLLASSESDGWDASRNVPWSSRAQSNGMVTSPVQMRSQDRSAASFSDSKDASGYFAQPVSNSMGPSPNVGQRSYLESGSERISPVGEASIIGNRYRGGDRRNVYAGTPVTTAYQTQSGFTSPLEGTRSEQLGSLPSMPQTLADTMHPRGIRSNYAHSSHNSASFAPRRPSHSTFPSFHSETQFTGRYGDEPTELSAELERMQLNGTHSAESRPNFVSHTSWDSSLSRMRNPIAGDAETYPALQSYANDGFAQNYAYAENSPQIRQQDLSAGHYMTTSNARANGYNNGRRYNGGLAHNASDNQNPMLQNRHALNHSIEPYQMAPLVTRQQQLSAYEYSYPNPAALANPHPIMTTAALASRAPVARGPSQDERIGPVLQEYRSTLSKKKWELKDIFGYIVEFSGDQHGSRFLQTKIETANSDDKERAFCEIQPDCLQLAKDIFGNYVIQKMFEHGNQIQKKTMANCMKGQVVGLAKSSYGCRVVQKALEHVLTDQQISIVKELETDVIGCVRCQHGNHVIQKAIERVPSIYTKRLVEAFRGQVEAQATHMYGCRVVQRMLEHCDDEDRIFILAELHACTPRLIEDQYGNYVIQHVIQHGEEPDRAAMIVVVMHKLLSHSKHKFASNVVEKAIEHGNPTQSQAIIRELTSAETITDNQLYGLMIDQYGNYVIQKILTQMKAKILSHWKAADVAERDALRKRLRPLLDHLKKTDRDRYNGKQFAAIEKLIEEELIEDPCPYPNGSTPASNPGPASNPAASASDSTIVASQPTVSDGTVVTGSGPSSTTPPHSHKSSPQQVLRSVNDGFMQSPPTPPSSDKQTNGTDVVTSTVQ
ncbi:mRNA-binding protein PUF3 [Aspergillus stella-maris]|uniref:mRNA-binding protein PUF3 n=1 Tax=Aspergillus stella-maris TaxID=1810926 RepID=UPI003CCCA1AB